MLELRPNCELCDCDLPPHSDQAMICTYECTYCANCVETVLQNACPTCGGGFQKRPFRPQKSWRVELKLGLQNHPASSARRHTEFTSEDIVAHVERIKRIAPQIVRGCIRKGAPARQNWIENPTHPVGRSLAYGSVILRSADAHSYCLPTSPQTGRAHSK